MKRLLIPLIVSLFSMNASVFAHPLIDVIPEPNSIVYGTGSFSLSRSTSICCPNKIGKLGKYLNGQLVFFTHLNLRIRHARAIGSNLIALRLDRDFKGHGPEAYSLDVSSERVVLTAGTEEGLFRGLQTLLQLIPLPESVLNGIFGIPSCKIVDYPRFAWRGLNLDCVRHFMTPAFVKRYIDLLAYYKSNVFHWHLTDDQGWRIQIKKYPKLTSIGAWRNEGNGERYGGYYTQKEIKDIVAYAASRFITVVPEIEMPGHCQASLAAYPENACVPGPFQVGTQWGVYQNIYDPAKKSTFTFLENVLSEVVKLFPSHYIHIGGDEVPKNEWEQNAGCQKLMKEKGLKNTDELQSYFIRKIQKFLESKGRQIIGWNEILEGKGPRPGAVVESWQGIDGAIKAVRKGDYTIVSPGEYTYLSRDADDLSLDSVYSFDPMPPGLTPSQQKRVLGTEASMWSEHAPQRKVDSKMFPRLLAIAEDAWTSQQNKNYENFHLRLQDQYNRLAYLGVDYGLEQRGMTYKTEFDKGKKMFTVSLKPTQAGIILRYAIGDTLTMSNSHRYEKPVSIDTTATFIAQAEMKGKLAGNPLVLSFMIDKALGSRVNLANPYSPEYTAGGPQGLVDGIRGTLNFKDGLWQGFKGTDLDATVDMGKKRKLSELGAGFLQSTSSYIFMPEFVQFFVSKDGKNFESVGILKNDISERDPATVEKDFVINFRPKDVRYFKVVAKNIGACPPWHPGAGAKAWIFTDELFAN
jgi:hexosaminidase